jgi:2-methylcitrate dehydratase PrpD
MTATEVLSRFIVDTAFTDLPENVVAQVQNSILDTLACGIAGFSLERESLSPILNLVKMQGGHEEATVIVDGFKTNALHAALANGCLIHSIDFDDTHQAALTHTSSVMVPAAFAIGEKMNASGKDVILAIALGFEAATKVGQSVMPDLMRFWHSTALNGTIGAAAVAGKLLGLSAPQMNHAFGIAADIASGTLACIEFGDITKSLHAGTAAMKGILAALLVREGAQGPQDIFDYAKGYCHAYSDHPKIDAITDNLGNPYEILVNGVKGYPSILASHTSIKAVTDIVQLEHIDPRTIKSIAVKTYNKVEESFCNYDPQTLLAARLSVPFCIALAAVDGFVTLKNFTEDRVHDPAIRALMSKVSVTGDPELNALYPEKFPAHVALKIHDGTVFTQDEYYPKGSANNPLTETEFEEKFMSLVTNTMSEEQGRRILNAVSRMQSMEAMSELATLLVRT